MYNGAFLFANVKHCISSEINVIVLCLNTIALVLAFWPNVEIEEVRVLRWSRHPSVMSGIPFSHTQAHACYSCTGGLLLEIVKHCLSSGTCVVVIQSLRAFCRAGPLERSTGGSLEGPRGFQISPKGVPTRSWERP
jgi:hypothetical protein